MYSPFLQTDIAGNCHTQYTTGETGWYSKTIKKSKNLLSCTERNGFNTAIQGVPYSADSVSYCICPVFNPIALRTAKT